MKLRKPTQIRTVETFGARKLECDRRSCFVQSGFLGRMRAKLCGEDIDEAPYDAQFRLPWLGTAGASKRSLPRYEALQESLEDDYTLFVVEKDGLALIKSNIAILLRE